MSTPSSTRTTITSGTLRVRRCSFRVLPSRDETHDTLRGIQTIPLGVYDANMRFPEEVTKDALNRLRRAEGQLRGVQRLLDEGADCKDVVTQISAVQAALHRAGLRLMASGMRYCITNPEVAESDGMSVDDMEDLFLTLR
jgi:DNA-binding FrmR family transcriptional regulator